MSSGMVTLFEKCNKINYACLAEILNCNLFADLFGASLAVCEAEPHLHTNCRFLFSLSPPLQGVRGEMGFVF